MISSKFRIAVPSWGLEVRSGRCGWGRGLGASAVFIRFDILRRIVGTWATLAVFLIPFCVS